SPSSHQVKFIFFLSPADHLDLHSFPTRRSSDLSSAPFLAGAKLPSRKDSLHCSCFRSLSSARNARQILSQTPCSSQSRSLRQHVAGEGNSSGKSCQRAPLRRIHTMPSSTLRSEARGRPPRRRERGRGSKGRIFSHWASVNRRPYRAIGPPAALLTLFISHFRQPNYLRIQGLHPVLKQLLVRCGNVTAEDTEFAGGGADFIQRLFEPGNIACFDVNEKLVFPGAAMNRTAFNLEQIDAVPGKRLE